VSEVVYLNADVAIELMLFERVSEVSDEAPEKALSPIEVTLFGIVSEVSEVAF
jgi:hypothetical protein